MKRIIMLLAAAATISGCDKYRNDPGQQVKDFATCKAGGMAAYLNAAGEITCYPAEKQRLGIKP